MLTPRTIFTRPLVVALVLASSACEQEDIGTPCPMELSNPGGGITDGDLERSSGNSQVEYDVNFPCESLVCVRQLDRDPMCSAECSDDTQCPAGFTCAQVTELGSNADRRFCIWAECETDADCGDPWTRYCAEFRVISDTGPAKFCAPREITDETANEEDSEDESEEET